MTDNTCTHTSKKQYDTQLFKSWGHNQGQALKAVQSASALFV